MLMRSYAEQIEEETLGEEEMPEETAKIILREIKNKDLRSLIEATFVARHLRFPDSDPKTAQLILHEIIRILKPKYDKQGDIKKRTKVIEETKDIIRTFLDSKKGKS